MPDESGSAQATGKAASRRPGRPPVTSRGAVERAAITLMLRSGYADVSVDRIAAAAGIGRSTFFRYFASKPAVVWAAFDGAISALRDALAATSPDEPVLQALSRAVVHSTRASTLESTVWLERFELLDTEPALRAEAGVHWQEWSDVVAEFVALRRGERPAVVAGAVAGAVQATYLVTMRSWLPVPPGGRTRSDEELLDELAANLTLVSGGLVELLDAG
ncbi:MAG: TetR family transcriptional regulator [Janthinobacterium lividum]